MGILKNHSDLRALKEAGRITRGVLAELGDALQPGFSTLSLETLANRILSQNRSTAPFKSFDGFNHAICVSINDEIVNGPPDRERTIQAGDLVSIATAAEARGIHAKAARTFYVGTDPSEDIRRLLNGTRAAIAKVIQRSTTCKTINDLVAAVPETASEYRLTIIRDLGGAGIGKKLHEVPLIPNHPENLEVVVPLEIGMAFTLMPMFTLGESDDFFTHEDGWTYITSDHALCAHFADTLLMTESGLINVTDLG